MMTLRFIPPESGEFPSPDSAGSLIVDCAQQGDGIEHVHVRASYGEHMDVVIFVSAPDLSAAQVKGTVFCSRLLLDSLRGWQLTRAWLECAG